MPVTEEEKIYEVEKILSHAEYYNGTYMYKVQWKGWFTPGRLKLSKFEGDRAIVLDYIDKHNVPDKHAPAARVRRARMEAKERARAAKEALKKKAKGKATAQAEPKAKRKAPAKKVTSAEVKGAKPKGVTKKAAPAEKATRARKRK